MQHRPEPVPKLSQTFLCFLKLTFSQSKAIFFIDKFSVRRLQLYVFDKQHSFQIVRKSLINQKTFGRCCNNDGTVWRSPICPRAVTRFFQNCPQTLYTCFVLSTVWGKSIGNNLVVRSCSQVLRSFRQFLLCFPTIFKPFFPIRGSQM